MRGRMRLRFAVLWIALVIVGGLSLNLYYALRPSSVRAQIQGALSNVLAVPVEFSSCELSWKHGAVIRDVRIAAAPEGSSTVDSPFFTSPLICVRPRLLALLSGRFEIGRVIVQSARALGESSRAQPLDIADAAHENPAA